MPRRPFEIASVRPCLDARTARYLARFKEYELRVAWCADLRKVLEDAYMADTVDHKIIARLKAARGKDIAAKLQSILIDPGLPKVLQRLPIIGIASASCDLTAQVIAKARPLPTERFGDFSADG